MTRRTGVRPMAHADRRDVAALLAAAGLPEIRGDAPIDHFVVADEDGRVVGAAGLEPCGDAVLLRSVVVAADARGRGRSTALIDHALARAHQLDAASIWLLTTTAAGLFRKFGFVEAPRGDAPPGVAASSEFRGLCPASAVCMRKDLRPVAVGAGAADADPLRDVVRERYAATALRVVSAPEGGCCGGGECDPISRDLYDSMQAGEVPSDALLASLGCGNPTALARLAAGETVLDLGSGGGIDVLLSAKRVGPTGFAYGLDMTDEMLALAEKNRAAAGATNVKFLKGHIESIPLADASVDVIVSNCVINLSTDKARVLREGFRVLRPGGRFAVSDMVVEGAMPADVRRDVDAWAGCIAGALEDGEYRRLLAAAGFVDVEIEVTRVHDRPELASRFDGRLVSAFVRAKKPR